MRRFKKIIIAAAAIFLGACTVSTAQTNEDLMKEIQRLKAYNNSLQHTFDMIIKNIDDVLWYEKVGDVAYIDKVYLTGEPKAKQGSPTSRGYNNPFKFWNYVFIPKTVDPNKKYPLIVFPHSGVHADMSTYYAHIIRELMAQEYIVIATEYRGSTGYGEGMYKAIDYGERLLEKKEAEGLYRAFGKAALAALIEQHLHAQTYAEKRFALRHFFAHYRLQPRRAQLLPRVRERAHARQYYAVRIAQHAFVRGDFRAHADKAQRTDKGEQIPHAVIHYRDHNVPLVLGSTSARAASTEHASLSALPKDLNTASAMWCTLEPYNALK